MEQKELEQELAELEQRLAEMNERLDEAREDRSSKLRKRFDMKENRRYLRNQLKEANAVGNAGRAERLQERLDALEQEITALDAEVVNLENVIETEGDSSEAIRAEIDRLKQLSAEPAEAPEAEAEQAGAAEEGDASRQDPFYDNLEFTVDRLNALLQKGLKRATDALENVDFETLGKNVQGAAEKAAKTVSDAAKSVETAYAGAKENRSRPGGIGDYRISGSGVMDGGCYNRITASGVCKVSSDLTCRELKNSGSFRACGGIDCSGELRTSGSLHAEGDIACAGFSGTGAAKTAGNFRAGMVSFPGSLTVDGSLDAGEIRVSGALKVGGSCQAESFQSSGSLQIGGMLSADTVNIRVALAENKVDAIGGAHITVTQSATAGLLSGLLRPGTGSLVCDSIEGDVISLAGVTANIVRGANVTVSTGCVIERLEYTDTCLVDDTALVRECVKV